jgi:hypothetical protein
MTADNFVHWLQGFFDCMDGKPLLPADVAKIQMKMAEIDSKPSQHVSFPPGIRGLGTGGPVATDLLYRGGTVGVPFSTSRAHPTDPNIALCSSGVSGSLVAAGTLDASAVTASREVAQ